MCKIPIAKCSTSEPLPILYKHHQSGDIIIGAIMSQIYVFSAPATFSSPPSPELFDETVYVVVFFNKMLIRVLFQGLCHR